MRRLPVFALVAAVLAACASPLPAQEFAKKRLEESPRHHEWVEVPGEGRKVLAFVAYPEKESKTMAVIVIHENRGLTDWVRSFADQLAGEGYIAIAPDLLSGFDADRGRTSAFESSDAARGAIYELDPGRITRDLLAVREYASKIPAASRKTAVIGFCWGGSQAFRFATNARDLSATLVFYGTAPEDEETFGRIAAPVHGFYGGGDERVNATIERTRELMKKNGKTYEVEIYEGAGHAYMRRGDDPEGSEANRKARDESWKRIRRILSGIE